MTIVSEPDSPERLIQYYNQRMDAMSKMASPGEIRSAKGKLVEDLTQGIVQLACEEAGGDAGLLSFGDVKSYAMPVQADYIARQPPEVAAYLNTLRTQDLYQAHVDQHVFVDGQLVMGIECKSYSENAMLKRILVDFWLLKSQHPNLIYCLLQLESQLTGDYSNLNANPPTGSSSTHTLMSYFPEVDLHIITLLDGERKVNRPIHQAEYFKELRPENLERAIERLSELLASYV